MSRFSIYAGKFACQKCKAECGEARFWPETHDLTWQCASKHISKVNINGRGY